MSQFESMSLSEPSISDFKEPEKQNEELNHPTEDPQPLNQDQELSSAIEGQELYQEPGDDQCEHTREPKHKLVYDQFLKDLESALDAEEKLKKTIDFMEFSLSQTSTPHFKSFWDARTIALDLFKQNISSVSRPLFWNKYTELSKEARRLKEILEEQSAFAVEQIEVAVAALEKDIESNQAYLTQGSYEFSIICKSLERKYPYYKKVQSELNLLNVQASRINAMRKELIKTEMRIRQKNKFFQRLSSAGDLVFPRRKELIKEISQNFIEDIDQFIQENFAKGKFQDSLFFLREEIKSLQGMAKLLTLNTHSFTHTRLRLSECWDKIKGFEKDRKKARAHQKVVFKQNQESVQNKINELNESFSSKQLTINEALKKVDEITYFMRQVELGRDELKTLRDELLKVKQPIFEQQKKEELEKQIVEQERERQRTQLMQSLKNECENLVNSSEDVEAEKLAAERDALLEKIAQSSITKLEKQELERSLKPLRDIIADKKERALLDLSEDDRQKLGHLKELLKEKKTRRQEIKNQLEVYRRAKGSSGFDFEQAMNYNDQIASEKERLEKIVQGIKEIEEMIENIESQ